MLGRYRGTVTFLFRFKNVKVYREYFDKFKVWQTFDESVEFKDEELVNPGYE